MGLQTIKLEWDICSSLPWVPFYPYTMFQNLMCKPSCQKSRKTIITQKVLVTQCSNIVHCDWHTQNLYVQIFKPFQTLFPCTNWCFFIFCQGELSKQSKILHLLILTGKNASKWLEWCIYRVWGVPNAMAQVSSLYNKWFLKKIKPSGKNFTFCWFWLGKMHQNGLDCVYLGFETCQIQWHRFQVSTITSSWKIKISGKNFTFCWFWLVKMHWNGLSGAYLGFKACQI